MLFVGFPSKVFTTPGAASLHSLLLSLAVVFCAVPPFPGPHCLSLSGSLPPLALTSPASPGFRHIAYTPVAGAYGEQGAALTQSLSPAPKYGKPLFRFPSTSADGKGEEEEEVSAAIAGAVPYCPPPSSIPLHYGCCRPLNPALANTLCFPLRPPLTMTPRRQRRLRRRKSCSRRS